MVEIWVRIDVKEGEPKALENKPLLHHCCCYYVNIEQVDSRPFKSVALTEFVLSKDTTCKNQAICIGRRSLISYPGEIQTLGEVSFFRLS